MSKVATAQERYFEPNAELMTRHQLDELQQDKVLELASYVYEHAPLYRTIWDAAGVHPRDIGTIEDFYQRVPLISKDTIRAFRDRHGDPFGGLLCVDPKELSAIMSSSGTTGDATLFPEKFARWAPLGTQHMRSLWEHGLRPGDHVIVSPGTFRGGSMDDMRQLGCVAVGVSSWTGSWDEVLDAVERYDVRYLALLTPILGELERIAETRDMRQALASVKFASFAGEPLGSRMQARIREEWDTRLAMWTSAGDTGTAWQCREHDGYHIWEDTAIPEVVDPVTSTPVLAGGVGELVVTDIDNRVAPLVRYRAGDFVRVSTDLCGCGRSHARMWPLGRVGDRTVVAGKSIMPVEVWSVIEQCDETRTALFQIVRPVPEPAELRIRIGYAPERTASLDALHDRLRAGIYAATGVYPVLELVDEQDIIARASSPGKIPRVVTR